MHKSSIKLSSAKAKPTIALWFWVAHVLMKFEPYFASLFVVSILNLHKLKKKLKANPLYKNVFIGL